MDLRFAKWTVSYSEASCAAQLIRGRMASRERARTWETRMRTLWLKQQRRSEVATKIAELDDERSRPENIVTIVYTSRGDVPIGT